MTLKEVHRQRHVVSDYFWVDVFLTIFITISKSEFELTVPVVIYIFDE